jgi:hypothetical protein
LHPDTPPAHWSVRKEFLESRPKEAVVGEISPEKFVTAESTSSNRISCTVFATSSISGSGESSTAAGFPGSSSDLNSQNTTRHQYTKYI